MKVLFIHADYMVYRVKGKTKVAEELGPGEKQGSMEEPLIAFVSVEKEDEDKDRVDELVEVAFNEIKEVALMVKSKNIALFPFAHLSGNLASPKFAISTLKALESRIKGENYNIVRAPFGWYKEFEFRSKGHPLSALSRSVSLQV